MISIGNRFYFVPTDKVKKEQYILVQSESNYVCLINLQNGNRWNNAVFVNHPNNLTPGEWAEVSNRLWMNKQDSFIKIES